MASVDVSDKRETFFRLIFGRATGYVCIATLSKGRKFEEQFYEYPDELPSMLENIEAVGLNSNVYFCPQLLSERSRQKQFVIAPLMHGLTLTPADQSTCWLSRQ